VKFLLILATLFTTLLLADKTVIKTVTVNQMEFPKKTLSELKDIALQKAKLEAAKEIFGEFLLTETVMVNGKVQDDVVREKSGGVIHIKGEPKFKNGENFGDLQVTVEAYATDEEIQDVTPHFIRVNDFKYTNSTIPAIELKAAARGAFIIEALSSKKPSIRNVSADIARQLALSVQIVKSAYDEESATYLISGVVEYIPAFLRNADLRSKDDNSNKIDKSRDYLQNPQERIERVKRGFYGVWSGFIIRSNGGSGDVIIEITETGIVTINYNSLKCGGELIIESKTADLVKFKEKLTYGDDKCVDKHSVVLKKINRTQLLFMQFNERKQETAKGTLYLE